MTSPPFLSTIQCAIKRSLRQPKHKQKLSLPISEKLRMIRHKKIKIIIMMMLKTECNSSQITTNFRGVKKYTPTKNRIAIP